MLRPPRSYPGSHPGWLVPPPPPCAAAPCRPSQALVLIGVFVWARRRGQDNIKGNLKKRTFLLPPLFIFRKVVSSPTLCTKASPEAFTPLLFFTCDYNKSLIPQTDLRTINKYKRKRNISSVTKTASKGVEFCGCFTSLSKQSRSPTEKGIQKIWKL